MPANICNPRKLSLNVIGHDINGFQVYDGVNFIIFQFNQYDMYFITSLCYSGLQRELGFFILIIGVLLFVSDLWALSGTFFDILACTRIYLVWDKSVILNNSWAKNLDELGLINVFAPKTWSVRSFVCRYR